MSSQFYCGWRTISKRPPASGGPGWPPRRLCRRIYPARAAEFADAPGTTGGLATVRTLRRSMMEFEHAFCRPGLEPLEVFARLGEILFGHPAVRRPHQQQRLDRGPGAAGGLGDDLHHAGVFIEDRPFGGLDRTAGENRQGHCRLFEVLRARGRMNTAFAEFMPVLQPLHPPLGLGVIRRLVANLQIDVVDHLGYRILHGIGKLRICRPDPGADRSRGSLEKLQEVMPGNVMSHSDPQRELGIVDGARDELAKAAIRKAGAGVVRDRTDDARVRRARSVFR